MLTQNILRIAPIAMAVLLNGACRNEAPADAASPAPASAATPLPAALEAYVAESRRWYDEELQRIEGYIESFRTSDSFKGLEAPWRQELDRHKAAGLEPMHFGRDRTRETAEEVFHITWTFEPGRLGYVDAARIIEFGDTGTLVSVKDDPDAQKARRRVLVKGLDLSAHKEGDLVDLPGLMLVTGEATYESSGRQITTFVLEPFDVEPFRSRVPEGMLRGPGG